MLCEPRGNGCIRSQKSVMDRRVGDLPFPYHPAVFKDPDERFTEVVLADLDPSIFDPSGYVRVEHGKWVSRGKAWGLSIGHLFLFLLAARTTSVNATPSLESTDVLRR